MCHLVSTVRKA